MFAALASPGRRRLLDALHERAGLTLGDLCAVLDMRRQSVSQHLEVLAAANLVTSVRDGRRKLHYLNPVPIHQIQNRWIEKFEEPRLALLDDITNRAEENAMTGRKHVETIPDYVYTTYINATAEQVWNAMTSADLTARFWGHAQISDWKVGSRVDHVRVDGSDLIDAAGTVLEVDPPHRLSFSFGDPAHAEKETGEGAVVTFDVEQHRDIAKLTLTQSSTSTADRDSAELGWPTVIANLKTLLETGDVLPTPPWEFHAEARATQMARHDDRHNDPV